MAPVDQTEERKAKSEFFSRLRSYCIFVPLIYLYTGIMGTLSLLSSFFDRDGRVQHWFAHTWSRMILTTAGIRICPEGLEHVDPAQPAVYAANHLSALDIPVLYAGLPRSFASWPSASFSATRFSDGTSRAPGKFPSITAMRGRRCAASIAPATRCARACPS